MRTLGTVAGLLGGSCWAARWGADLAGADPVWAAPAYWLGLALLALALATVGAGLVSRSAAWLRVVVAVALPLLVWSLYAVVRGSGESPGLDGVLGVLAAVLAGAALVTSRRSAAATTRPAARGGRHGSHAAR